jgi:DNA-binding response OmpR family regulator
VKHETARILLADADPTNRAFLADNLAADGYGIAPVATDHAALAELAHGQPGADLLLVDVNGHTLGLLDAIRDPDTPLGPTPEDLPVVVLTSNTQATHRVRLLERGADDVVGKPFSYAEVRARIAAVMRRVAPRQDAPVIVAGDLRVDLRDRQVTVAGLPISVSSTEYRLLCTLGAEPSRVFTRAELMVAVWGHAPDVCSRTLDSHAHRLRRKLSAAEHPLLVNVWGVGLQLLPAATGVARRPDGL